MSNSNVTDITDIRELIEAELEHVSGGKDTPKLLETAVKGHVYKSVEIHGTA